ncbi:hypothetical protein D3C76_1605480 [compost metagenome]
MLIIITCSERFLLLPGIIAKTFFPEPSKVLVFIDIETLLSCFSFSPESLVKYITLSLLSSPVIEFGNFSFFDITSITPKAFDFSLIMFEKSAIVSLE